MSWEAIVAEWLRQGKAVKPVLKQSTGSRAIPARREIDIGIRHDGEAILLPSLFLFDSPKCGVRYFVDDLDTDRFLTVERVRKNLGMIQYNGWVYSPRYETGYYALVVVVTPPSTERFELRLFNDDTSDHNVLEYSAPFMRVVSAPKRTQLELLEEVRKEVRELGKAVKKALELAPKVPPPAPKFPPIPVS